MMLTFLRLMSFAAVEMTKGSFRTAAFFFFFSIDSTRSGLILEGAMKVFSLAYGESFFIFKAKE